MALARAPLPKGGFYEDLCFHAQQAAEKALKAAYIPRGWAFRYVHDLDELITGLQEKGIDVPEEFRESVILTSYAFEVRYPGFADPVTEDEYTKVIVLAERVVQWAESLIAGATWR
ncbi:HEPN domain-containing protein [Candidatus Methylomirabilis lanthanidiphila]|uniref:HEPN domain-containing protein n=1 Tax=Candidatus Methylomirabilis lanthanidiphila TaxID=2211376 RepID=A0A564ZLS2_9BACT|nr:HEPN domain-containing protein [Candidatus Methylomirabilis lanthanidiphila]VUZ86281.1 HEPN domain-containing protein [Candidatus Methylomirabilis lanthanidiphila]